MKIPFNLKLNKASLLLRNKQRIVILAILATAIILGSNFFFKPRQQTVQFVQVKRQDIRSVVSSSGSLTGKSVVNLKFKSSGKLAYINVRAGDSVYAGQVIAGLDTQAFSIALQQAQNTFVAKDAAAKKAEDDVKNHDKDETFAQKETRTAAQVARDNAYDSIKEAQRAFQDAVLISPIAGVITQSSVSVPGQNVTSSDLIAQTVDFPQTFFDTDVDESDISKVALEQVAQVTLDAYPDKIFKGIVSEIIPQTKTTSSGATVITVRIRLEEAKIAPVNGLSGQAEILLSEVKGALTLPQEAIGEDNNVFVQTPAGLRMEKVETGIKSDTDIEIKAGLNEKDRILLNPPTTVTRINQNKNPLQGIIFRVFGGSRRFGEGNGERLGR